MWIEKEVQCPYCWEEIQVLIDPGAQTQNYIEDCQVCCRPIHFIVELNAEGDADVQALHEDET